MNFFNKIYTTKNGFAITVREKSRNMIKTTFYFMTVIRSWLIMLYNFSSPSHASIISIIWLMCILSFIWFLLYWIFHMKPETTRECEGRFLERIKSEICFFTWSHGECFMTFLLSLQWLNTKKSFCRKSFSQYSSNSGNNCSSMLWKLR